MTLSAVPPTTERRRAWAVIFLLAAVLAASASFGVDHQYASKHASWQACTATATICSTEPARPAGVWVFAALAAVAVVTALVLWSRTVSLRVRPGVAAALPTG